MDFAIYVIVIAAFVGGLMWYRRRHQAQEIYAMPLKKNKGRKMAWKLPRLAAMKVKKHREPQLRSEPSPSIVVVTIKARAGAPFASYELLQALSNVGLHYGDMKIFHRYAHVDGEGSTLFSVATLNNPGTFDMSNFGHFSCTGLCLFTDLDKVDSPLAVFDLLLETAYQLAEDLNGDLFEGQTKPWGYESAQRLRAYVQAQYAH